MNTDIENPRKRKLSGITGIIFIISLILKNPFVACTNMNLPFYDKVLNDFDSTSYFIALDLKSPYYKPEFMRLLIKTQDIFCHFFNDIPELKHS